MTVENTFRLAVFAAFCLAVTMIFFSNSASAQNVLLTPDSLTGEFTARANTATDDIRLDRVCLYRIDSNSPDPVTEFACASVGTGRTPTASEAAPNGEGVVVDITFTTTLVVGENQEFVARNIAQDFDSSMSTFSDIQSDPSSNLARIVARPFSPVFIIIAPSP
jgi:hypothetical protein